MNSEVVRSEAAKFNFGFVVVVVVFLSRGTLGCSGRENVTWSSISSSSNSHQISRKH